MRRRGLPAADAPDGDPARRRWRGRRRVEPQQDLVVRARRRAARDRARPPRPRGRARRPVDRRATSSRCPVRSTPAPTRSSATSSPSGARASASDEVRVSPTTRSRSATRCATCSRRSLPDRSRHVGRARRHGRDAPCSSPRPTAASGSTRRRSSRSSRRPATPRSRYPIVETAMVAAPLGLATPERSSALGRRSARGVGRPAPDVVLAWRRPPRCRVTAAARPSRPSIGDPSGRTSIGRPAPTGRTSTLVRPRRARHRRAARRARAGDARPDRRLREGAAAVRRADRLVPGGEAPPGRRADGARVRPPGGVPGRVLAGQRRADGRPRRVDGQGDGVRRGVSSSAGRRCSATAPSATRSSTTCTSSSSAPGRSAGAWGDCRAGIATASSRHGL